MDHIFIVSDGTGGTAELLLRAGLVQFSDADVRVVRRSDIRSREQILEVVREAADARGLIVHTIVSTDLRIAIGDLGRLHGVETMDLMGPLLAQLAFHLSDAPAEKPGVFRELNKEYFKRIEAMEFAFRHDDGQRVNELHKADIVLLGVSRTFKTPLSIYLAFKGFLVGNVPIILTFEPPESLFELDPTRIFCLTTDAQHLAVLRRVRHDYLGGATGQYAEPEYIREELSFAARFFSRRPAWARIEVTKKPIEEIAAEILRKLRHAAV